MLISLVIIAAITGGGATLTYSVSNDRPLLWRLASGWVIGSAISGIAALLFACAFGLTVLTASLSVLTAMVPLAFLSRKETRSAVAHDWAKAKGKLSDGGKRFGGFAFYVFFLVVFCLFFAQTMYQTSQGIFTGGSQNLGDLPFHLGAIFSFTDGANFPPQNPSYSGARFSYPFIADLLSAVFVRFGADVKGALIVQNISWAFALLVLLEGFVARITGSKLAGRIAPFLLFFSGGLGFLWFFKDFAAQGKGIWEFLWALPRDYTISDQFRWGNSLVVLFITQRSLLLGMPLTLIVLGWLWKIFSSDAADKNEAAAGSRTSFISGSSLLIGLIAGALPLIHLHSLAVLFVVTGTLFILRHERWREWISFGAGVCLIAIPELLWSMSGSASETSKFFDWHFGWDKGEMNLLWFWLKNTGLVIPFVLIGIGMRWFAGRTSGASAADEHRAASDLLHFYVPFVLLFMISNVAKLAPWEWDNIKVLIYWFVGSLPLVAYALARIWNSQKWLRLVAVAAILVLTLSGGLDVWRTMTGQNKIKVFDADSVKIAELIKAKVPVNALFLNAPTYNSAVVLTGRPSFMRYSGHLASHGIDYIPREETVRNIYQGDATADLLLRKNGIDYVIVSPAETGELTANAAYFGRYPLIAESGPYRVYQVK